MLSKATRTMALIREPCHKRDFRQRQVCPGEDVLHTTHPALHKISMRGKTRRLLEGVGEVIHRFLRYTGEHLKADILLKVRFDIFAHASQAPGGRPPRKRGRTCTVAGAAALRVDGTTPCKAAERSCARSTAIFLLQ